MRCFIALLLNFQGGEGSFDCVDRVKRLKSLASTIHYERISHNLNTRLPFTVFFSLLETIRQFQTRAFRVSIPIMVHYSNTHNPFSSKTHDTPNPSPLHSIFIAATSHTHILTPLPPQYNPIKESFSIASLLSISKQLIQPRFNTDRRINPFKQVTEKTPIQ